MNKHPLQTEYWAEFRKKTGLKVINVDDIIVSIHPIPHTNFSIAYIPKSLIPKENELSKLVKIAKEENCIFIQLEPNVEYSKEAEGKLKKLGFKHSAHPLLTRYNFILDLTKTEEEILKNMHPKTRYNIRLAEKRGVKIEEDNSDKNFEEYLRLTKETTSRQKFYAHDENYHRLMWETLKPKKTEKNVEPFRVKSVYPTEGDIILHK